MAAARDRHATATRTGPAPPAGSAPGRPTPARGHPPPPATGRRVASRRCPVVPPPPPRRATQQPKGSTVTLEVSRGNQFRMPDLTGTRYSDVAAALQRAGWRAPPDQLTRHDVKTPDISRVDQVTQQSVPAGQAVSRDTRVDVGVNVFSLLP
ncbi:PASTA domain-containing protein [Corynebacterium bovis]|uniref:PASTA domain-containing protein n=1 Tax=Corynebacterium bovis TaxID=36808 RepID=UPI0036995980